MLKQYRILIGTPFCNEEHSISQYVRGLLNIDYPKELIDLVWIENNSSDNTWKLLEKFYNRIKTEYHYHSFILLRKTNEEYGNLPKEEYGRCVSGKVHHGVHKSIRRARAHYLCSLLNFIMEKGKTHDFCVTIMADVVVPANVLERYIKVMEDYSDCGWVGGVMHRRYPKHNRGRSRDPLSYGLCSPAMKSFDGDKSPKHFKEEWMRRTKFWVKWYQEQDAVYPHPFGVRGTIEEEILERQNKGKGIFEVAITGHVWMVRKAVIATGLRFKTTPAVETGSLFCDDMNKLGYKMLCDSYVYIKHISVDGIIYRSGLQRKIKIVLIVGTRPQLIKSTVLSHSLSKEDWIDFQLWDTGQHYDFNLAGIFIKESNLKPTLNFNVRSGSQANQLSRIMVRVEEELLKFKPDLVIVIGDTNSTLGASLASAKLHIPVAHVEAGPREHFIGNPPYRDARMLEMPEDVNRIMIDHCSSMLFAPTKSSVKNLKKEQVLGKIYFTGDVSYDVLLRELPKKKKLEMPIPKTFNLLTVHRAENTNNLKRLQNIVEAIIEANVNVVFPIHPRTVKKLKEFKLYNKLAEASHIYLIPPVGLHSFIELMLRSNKIFTDSGGVQKEAFLLSKPCVVLNEHTGWIELAVFGTKYVGTNKMKIIKEMRTNTLFKKTNQKLFGDGTAVKQILRILRKWNESNRKA